MLEAVLRFVCKPKMIFSDQGGVVACLREHFWQSFKFGDGVVMRGPCAHLIIVEPGVDPVL